MGMKIGMNAPRRKGYRIDTSSLPVVKIDRMPRVFGVFLMLFGSLWGGIPVLMFVRSILTGGFEPEMFFWLIFIAVGVALMCTGLWLLTYRKKIAISHENVDVDIKSVFGHKLWDEPLRQYKGVLARSEYHSGGKNSPSYTLFIIELLHEDKKKNIRLYDSTSDDGFRAVWKDFCRDLNMPALEKEGEDVYVREVEDLDKSARELAREGKLEVDFDPDKAPPKGFQIDVLPEGLQVKLPGNKAALFGVILALAFAGVFIYLGFLVEDAPLVFGFVGLAFAVIMIAVALWIIISNYVLLIGPEKIHIYHQTPWGDTKGKVFKADDIESVRIGKMEERQRKDAVLITTADTTETIGSGLPAAKLEWLKNCILAVIT